MKLVQYILSVLVIVLAAMAALTLVALDRPARTSNLVIISSNPEPVKVEFAQAFAQRYRAKTGRSVQVEWLSPGGGAQDQQRYIETQFQALATAKKHKGLGRYLPWMPLVKRLFPAEEERQGIGVDVFWGGGVDPYASLKKEGYLQRLDLPKDILDKIAPVCAGIPVYDQDGYWYGTALSGFGIIYNKELIEQLKLPIPKAWDDLADPRLIGMVSSGDPRQSGTAHMMIEIILQAYGWEKGFEVITKMSANIRTFSDSSALVPASVSLGEALYGLAIDFYAWSQMHKDKPGRVDFVMPPGLTVVTPDGIAILKGAPHPDLAQAFVEFVLSEEGQMLWILPPGAPGGPKRYQLDRISVVPTAYDRCGGRCTVPYKPTDFQTRQKFYSSEKARDRRNVLNDLMGALMIDTHVELAAAWQAVVAEKLPPDAVRTLCKVPITEAEGLELARTKWKNDVAYRNKTIAEWIDQARARYAELAGGEERRKTHRGRWIAGAAVAIALAILAWVAARRRARTAQRLRT